MKKRWTIGVVVYLAITFFMLPLFAQAQYSYRFEKFLELIEHSYLQPNNVSREQMEKNYTMIPFIEAALAYQDKYKKNRGMELCYEFKKDIDAYIGIQSRLVIEMGLLYWDMKSENNFAKELERLFGKGYQIEGDQIPSYDKWASDGYPPFEIEVRPLPPPEPLEQKPPVQGKKAVRDDEKAIKLLEEEGEATEDLSIDDDYWPAAPDPSSAPDFDEFMEDQ